MSYLVEGPPEYSTATVIHSFKELEDFERERPAYDEKAPVTILLHWKQCTPCKRYFPKYSATSSALDVRATIECDVLNNFTADQRDSCPLAGTLWKVVTVPTVLKLGAGGAFVPAKLL